ncbi:MAG TPA: type II toxin-antitoxin system prevent-host-death family antitoxin [Terracidiphilus sp.]|nr:type II toxin-antitoxin system prevent-host-death family antitoxin [Terracidiphilus sp.]
MIKLTASAARARFYWVLDQVEAGQTVLITRRGKVVARIERFPPVEIENLPSSGKNAST